jgi:hypothetical protein
MPLRAAPPSCPCVRRSGANEDGRRSGLSSGAAAADDSYRFAALSHESRNLRKSSRVSLSAASCARAAHSAACCRQYPIFSCMAVSTLCDALCALMRSRGVNNSTPEKAVGFQSNPWINLKQGIDRSQRQHRRAPAASQVGALRLPEKRCKLGYKSVYNAGAFKDLAEAGLETEPA